MSRLGDLIKTERLRQRMTPKQVAKKCGVAESFIVDVESGRRIIADDLARRILKTIGLTQHTEADFSLDDIAATVDLNTTIAPRPVAAPKKEAPAAQDDGAVDGSIWLDALSSVLKRVPVKNAVMQEVDHRLLPILSGKIEGAAPEKVFYFVAPDESMRGFRIHQNDLCFIVPSQSPIDGAVMLVEFKERRALRKIKKLDHFQVLLQSYGREYEADTASINAVNFIGRCVRIEISL